MRNIDAAMLAELEAGVVYPRIWVEVQLDGSTLRYWNGEKNITWNGQTWIGNGLFKDVGELSESIDSESGFSIDFAGESTALISTILNNVMRGKTGKVFFGFVSASNAVIATPIEFNGRLDSVEFKHAPDEANVRLNYDGDSVRMNDAKEFRYNAETQKIFYPSDLGFEFMEQLENYEGVWGLKKKRTQQQKPGASKQQIRKDKKRNKGNRGKGKV